MNDLLHLIRSTVDFAEDQTLDDETPTMRSFTKGLLIGRLQACASIARDHETQDAARAAEEAVYKLFRRVHDER
jgi:hypothetical protein